MFDSGIYAICDDSVRPQLPLVQKAQALLAGGLGVIQLRLKRSSLADSVDAARAISRLCEQHHALCLVNDRVDVAMIANAHGVHLGAEDLPVEQARSLLGRGAIIGATVRNLREAQEAFQQGSDYVGLGPIYPTQTKTVDVPPIGLTELRRICRASPLPVVAISGITLANVEEVAASGPYCAAVVSDLLMSEDIAAKAQQLRRGFEKGRNGG